MVMQQLGRQLIRVRCLLGCQALSAVTPQITAKDTGPSAARCMRCKLSAQCVANGPQYVPSDHQGARKHRALSRTPRTLSWDVYTVGRGDHPR